MFLEKDLRVPASVYMKVNTTDASRQSPLQVKIEKLEQGVKHQNDEISVILVF